MFSISKVKDLIQSGWQRFCDGTGLHGFIELYYAKALFWTVTWAGIVFGAMVVTLFMVRNAIAQYFDESSMTEIMPLDTALLYPPLSLCYIHWIYWVDWNKTSSLGMTKETVLYSMSFVNEIFSPTVFNIMEARENLTQIMKDHDMMTLSELYRNISMNFPMVIGTSGEISYMPKEPFFFNTKKIVFKENEWYMCYTVSSEEILQILDDKRKKAENDFRAAANIFNFSIKDPNYSSTYSKHISYEEYNFYMAYYLCRKSNYWVLTLKDFSQNYSQFTLPIHLYLDGYDTHYESIITDNDFYKFTMTPSVHRWKSTVQDPCLKGRASIDSDDTCQNKCFAIHDAQTCSCMDIDLAANLGKDQLENLCRKRINFLPYKHEKANPYAPPWCDMFDASSINLTAKNGKKVVFDMGITKVKVKNVDINVESEFNICMKNCVAPCEIWKYIDTSSVYTISPIVRKNTYKNQTDFIIEYPEYSDILVTVEIDARTWEDFVGNIGGLLGVWTGASLISFFQMFYLCCCSENSCSCFDRFQYMKPKKRKMIQPLNTNYVSSVRVEKIIQIMPNVD